jgi:predicted DNA-binding protein with PD1-like motif
MSLLESIGSQNIERLVQFRAKPDADLLIAIEEALELEGIRAGVIVSGLGALKKAVFRNLKWFPKNYPVTPSDRLYLEVEKPMELVSLMGWIAPQKGGGVEIHAHFSASTVENENIVTSLPFLCSAMGRSTLLRTQRPKPLTSILEICPTSTHSLWRLLPKRAGTG